MRVFIAYSSSDLELVSKVSSALRQFGHEVVRDETFLEPGDNIANRIREELLKSDALVVMWSKSARTSSNLLMELSFFIGAAGSRPVFPVLLDDSDIPVDIAGTRYYRAEGNDPSAIARIVASGLSKIEGEQQQSKIVAEQRKQEVEKSSEKYIADSLDSLVKREKKYQWWSLICYFLGYASILGGLAYAVSRITQEPPKFEDVSQSIYVSTLTLTAIGFLGAASRFTFVLGKSFMVESLRNHDRIHAIKFGEFYMKAFGEEAEWEDLKEAFQHWNLDTGSTFKEQKEDSVDPQVLKIISDIVKSVKK